MSDINTSSKAGFSASAEVVKKKADLVYMFDENGIMHIAKEGDTEFYCDLPVKADMTIANPQHTQRVCVQCAQGIFTPFKVQDAGNLKSFGLNYAIVTSSTEEIVAAFGSASLAHIVCREMNENHGN